LAPPLPWLKPAVLVGGLAPLGILLVRASTDALGANAVQNGLNQLGLLALLLLLASLVCTPLKRHLGWTWPLRIRKTLGVLAFAHAALHALTYVALDQGFAWRTLGEDLLERPFILVGFLALALLVPLAWTSTSGAVRRMGFAAWQRLHRLVYPAALLAVVHFFLRVKSDVSEPLVYAGVLAVLLAARVGALRASR